MNITVLGLKILMLATKECINCIMNQQQQNHRFYQNYILSYIDYDSVIWGAASGANIELLNRLQKRAAPIICTDNDTPSVDMFQNLGRLSVPDRLNYNETLLTYRAIHNMSPDFKTND